MVAARRSISVAMCTRNGAPFVAEQIRSILDQSVVPDQIVISDDASTDETVAIALAALAERPGPEITLLRNADALGVTQNFAQALEACTGDIVALSDQDDRWRADRLETGSRALVGDVLVAGSDARLVDRDGTPLGRTLFSDLEIGDREVDALASGRGFELLLRRNLFTGATMIIRRELVDLVSPFPASWVHDEWLALLAAGVGGAVLIPETLIDYRQHGANEIGSVAPTLTRKIRRTLQSRGERMRALSLKWAEFSDRVEGLESQVGRTRISLARDKARFELERARLPAARLRRVGFPLAHGSDYARFASRGMTDVVRDLLSAP